MQVNVVPCSRGRRSTTAWPRGVVFSFCLFSFCNTSITVTRETNRQELAEFLRLLQAARGLCQLWHMPLLHLPKLTRSVKPRSAGQRERGFFQLAEMGPEVLRYPHCCCWGAILKTVTPAAGRQSGAADSTQLQGGRLSIRFLPSTGFCATSSQELGPSGLHSKLVVKL